MQRLGDILVAQGAISRVQIEQYLPKLQGRIGNALRAHNLIRSRALALGLAEQQQLPFVALEDAPCAPGLFVPRNLGHYLRHHYLPYRDAAQMLHIITPDPSPALAKVLEVFYARPIALHVVSARDFTAALGAQATQRFARSANIRLRQRYKMLVADRVLLRPQMLGFALLGITIIVAIILAPAATWMVLITLANLFYFATLVFKLQLYFHGRAEQKNIAQHTTMLDAQVAAMPAETLPIYTILVPLYHETFPVLAQLVSHLHALDYPKEKLDIKLICEADDLDTIAALKQCKPPETMEILRVAPSYPRTKPKACNVALPQIRGEYLVIYDAEDTPDMRQLKRAAAMFAREPAEVACVQAALNYYNREQNLLTRLFSIEYSALFNLHLPAMQQLRLPIPLSGTSNHLRVSALEAVGGWDAFNVTEDADLGLRLAFFGYRTKMLPGLTLEESPIALGAWMRQRSRWIKGFMQTWLVYMRDPAMTNQHFGTRGYYGFQFFIGAPVVTFLISPFFWAALLLQLAGVWHAHLAPWLLALCGVSFFGGILVQLLYALEVVRIERWRGMRWAVAAYPLYWVLHSVASLRALWQLIYQPHHWEKTKHGVSRIFTAPN